MIAADTSTWIAFLQGDSGEDTEILDNALQERQVVMIPAVLTELLSDPKLPPAVAAVLTEVPLIETIVGYWERAGHLRSKVLAKGRKARLGDALIAQTCIDHQMHLVTRDHDFTVFMNAAGITGLLRRRLR